MLIMSVLQRSVGLIRGLGFARYLSDVELGQWALANSFLIIAVPIAVLGLPGSFGKFVEYYRTRNQLGAYFNRAVWVTLFGAMLTSILILATPRYFTWLVFGDEYSMQIVALCVLSLLTTIGMSFMHELVSGFRQVQTVSYMQFTQSFVFAVVGLTLVVIYRSWWVLLPSIAIANCLAIVPGWYKLRRTYTNEFRTPPQSEVGGGIWRRILPFAASLWAMNLLSNLFEVGDRYMLLHLVGGAEHFGQALVGQYHCARILPNLLISLGLMLGGVLLPYLSSDWEAGNSQVIRDRMRQLVQGVAIGFLALSIAAMIASPFLFQNLFSGRYELAQSALPLALAQSIWAALYLVAQAYLLCAERGKQLVVLLVISLTINLGLNWYLIQWYGLYGALIATAIANLVALGLLFWRTSVCGCPFDTGTILLCGSPVVLLAGPSGAMLCLVAIVFLAGRTEFLLKQKDREQMDVFILGKLERVGIRMNSIWP